MRRRLNEEQDDGFSAAADDVATVPVGDVMDVRFRKRVLDDLLLCPLCHGYFREATTIRECLHTFCRVCITLWVIRGKPACPVCHEPLPTRLEAAITQDPRVQNLVDKMHPTYAQPEADAALQIQRFLEARESEQGSPGKAVEGPNSGPALPLEAFPPVTEELLSLAGGDEAAVALEQLASVIWLELTPMHPQIPTLSRPHVACSPAVPVGRIADLVAARLGLTPHSGRVELLLGSKVLAPAHSLEFAIRSQRHSAIHEARFILDYVVVAPDTGSAMTPGM